MNSPLETHIQNQVLIRPTKFSDDLKHNNKTFQHRADYYEMIKYINTFLDEDTNNRYFLLPGIRGVGKTTILIQLYEYLTKEKQVSPTDILYITGDNLKRMSNSSIMDGINSYLDIFHNATVESIDKKIFLLIDEAQHDKDWSIVGKILYDTSKNIFMIFSGSSALELEYNADSARRMLIMPVCPLTYSQHLKLKYDYFKNTISKEIIDLIFTGKLPERNLDIEILNIYSSFKNYNPKELECFMQYGGFPSSFNQNTNETIKTVIDMINKVITTDIDNLKGINGQTTYLASQLLYFFALQNPGEISKGSMANHLDSNKMTINKILELLEKTQLIFHIEPFTSSAKRTTKPFKYYFATSSLKHILSTNLGNANLEAKEAYMGKLFENYVASSFFNLKNRSETMYNTYYDANKKNVDFLVQKGLETPVPIEVSWGKKNKSQVKTTMKKYKAPYGVIISNTTRKIVKEDNVIYLPIEIFSFM